MAPSAGLIVLAASAQTLAGVPLPPDWLGWLGLLIGTWGGLSIFQGAVAAFIDQHKKRPFRLRLSGYILPVGWISWGGLLIYGEPRPFPVLIVLLGLLAMLIAVSELRRTL